MECRRVVALGIDRIILQRINSRTGLHVMVWMVQQVRCQGLEGYEMTLGESETAADTEIGQSNPGTL
jgi:hypothetical protein